MRRGFAAQLVALVFLLAGVYSAAAQQSNYTPAPAFSGSVLNRSTLTTPTTITTANTFQTILPSTQSGTNIRQALTVENNNASNVYCYLYFGSSTATSPNSLLLNSGVFYRWDWPIAPSDSLQATCTLTGASLFVGVN
jgi:hypothetical protein